MERNLIRYYRENPRKLESHAKLNGFVFSLMLSAGVFGFVAVTTIYIISNRLAARDAGVEVAKLTPVNLNLLLATFVLVGFLCAAGMSFGSNQRLQMVRDFLEEQGAVSTERSDTVGIRLLGIPAGALVGGILGVGMMLGLW